MTICTKTLEAVKYEKGTFGWLKEQAKKDGFNSISEWNKHKYRKTIRLVRMAIREDADKSLIPRYIFPIHRRPRNKRPMYMHEKLAFPYLQSIGYDISDIEINEARYGNPDITTSDGKEWEVKISYNSILVFTKRQLENFSDSVQLLIYERHTGEEYPSEVISFGDFKNGLSNYHTKTTKDREIILRKSGHVIGICHQEFVYNEQNKLIDVKTDYRRA